MFNKRLAFVLVLLIGQLMGAGVPRCEALSKGGGAAGSLEMEAVWSRLPLRFELNQGQLDSGVLFASRGPGFNLSLTREGASLLFLEPHPRAAEAALPPRAHAVSLRLVGGNGAVQVAGESPAAPAHYFVGRDPSHWRRDVETYRSVRYSAIYPGVDLLFHGRNGRLEYDFVVGPGADPGQIELEVSGAEQIAIDAEGRLVMATGGQPLIQPRPVLYQEGPLGRREVSGGYVIHENHVRFAVAGYDRSLPLVIDPIFTYSSYLGGEGIEELFGIAHDAQGNIWASGLTASSSLPLAGAVDGAYGGAGDAFVSKFDKNGNLLFSTYLGGAAFEQAWAMTLDKAGNAYIVGNTKSPDFPVVGGIQGQLFGDRDAFLVKLNPSGSQILYSTYLGGTGNDWAYAIDLDPTGAIYISGETSSTDFPVKSAVQPTYHGGEDGFVIKLTPNGSSIVFSTYLGGGNTERAWGIQADAKGRVFVTGQTGSPNFPTVNAFQRRFGGGSLDAFVASIAADGKKLLYSTFAGGTRPDQGFGIAIDAKGNARVTGGAGNATFPVKQALQPVFGGGASDAFVIGVSKSGGLQFSTFIGGSLNDQAFAIGLDAKGNIYITGQTESPNQPVRNAMQTTLGGLRDGFLTKLRSDGKAYVYSTYVGGDFIDEGTTIDVDPSGVVYLGGFTDGDFPLVHAGQANFAGERDGVVARVNESAQALALSCSAAPKVLPRSSGQLVDVGLTVDVEGSEDPGPSIEVKVFGDDGATADDIESPEIGRLRLRAEKSSAENGRVYLIVVSAIDGAGKQGTGTCSVVVPSSPGAFTGALTRAAAAEEFFERQRAMPAGFARLDKPGAGVDE